MKLATLRLASEPSETIAALVENGQIHYLENVENVQKFLRLDAATQAEVIARAKVSPSIAEA